MAWYQCSCGFLTEMRPQIGDTITSVSHLHRSARIDGTSMIFRMEEIPDSHPPALASPEIAETAPVAAAAVL